MQRWSMIVIIIQVIFIIECSSYCQTFQKWSKLEQMLPNMLWPQRDQLGTLLNQYGHGLTIGCKIGLTKFTTDLKREFYAISTLTN